MALCLTVLITLFTSLLDIYSLNVAKLVKNLILYWWYSRSCSSYQDFLDKGLLLTRKLLYQGFLLVKLKSNVHMENWNPLFCRKVSFLTSPHCQFRGLGQGVKQTYLYLWYPLFQAQWIWHQKRLELGFYNNDLSLKCNEHEHIMDSHKI
jgi:hypothetical protein